MMFVCALSLSLARAHALSAAQRETAEPAVDDRARQGDGLAVGRVLRGRMLHGHPLQLMPLGVAGEAREKQRARAAELDELHAVGLLRLALAVRERDLRELGSAGSVLARREGEGRL